MSWGTSSNPSTVTISPLQDFHSAPLSSGLHGHAVTWYGSVTVGTDILPQSWPLVPASRELTALWTRHALCVGPLGAGSHAELPADLVMS